jgi:hypothetical protein
MSRPVRQQAFLRSPGRAPGTAVTATKENKRPTSFTRGRAAGHLTNAILPSGE